MGEQNIVLHTDMYIHTVQEPQTFEKREKWRTQLFSFGDELQIPHFVRDDKSWSR
jgi:hypothetical protein